MCKLYNVQNIIICPWAKLEHYIIRDNVTPMLFADNCMVHNAGGASPFQPSYQYRPYCQPGYPPEYNRPQGINDNIAVYSENT